MGRLPPTRLIEPGAAARRIILGSRGRPLPGIKGRHFIHEAAEEAMLLSVRLAACPM